MKKFIAFFAFLQIFFFSNAQNDKSIGFENGDFFISGNVGFSSFKNRDTDLKATEFRIIPEAGYFISDHIALGLELGYLNVNIEAIDTVNGITGVIDQEANSFLAGVYSRYYFTPQKVFSFFGSLGLDYIDSKQEQLGGNTDIEIDVFRVGLDTGINYFLSNSFALTTTIGILSYEIGNGSVDTSNFNIGLDFNNINFGLLYKI